MNTYFSSDVSREQTKQMIIDLVATGMSYSRIALRISVNPSTIQKLALFDRMPRKTTFRKLFAFYKKIFDSYGSDNDYSCHPFVKDYYLQHQEEIKNRLSLLENFAWKLDH